MQSKAFTKLFASITDSSIWSEDDATRIVWITMLAMSDSHGYVGASIPGLAARSRKSVEEVERALEKFRSPDAYSRTRDYAGRRITDVDGGWVLLNYEKHRAVLDAEADKEKKRRWAAKFRADAKAAAEAAEVDRKSRPDRSSVDESRLSPSVSLSGSGSGSEDPDPTRTRDRHEPPSSAGVFDAPTITVNPKRGRFAPADFTPTDAHRVRCQECKLDIDALLRKFKLFEFNRDYSDWDRRFSTWIEDARMQAEADRAKAISGAAKGPGSSFAGGRDQRRPPALEAAQKHRRVAAQHGIDLDEIVSDMNRQGVVEALGMHGAVEQLERRLVAAVKRHRAVAT